MKEFIFSKKQKEFIDLLSKKKNFEFKEQKEIDEIFKERKIAIKL